MLNLLAANHISSTLHVIKCLCFIQWKLPMISFYICKYNFEHFNFDKTKPLLVIVALLQPITAYHHHGLDVRFTPSDDTRYQLSANDPNKYVNFDNFDDSRRPGRQLPRFNYPNNPSNGFSWDEPSSPFRQNDFSSNRGSSDGFNWPSRSGTDDDSFIFEDDFENRNYIVRTTQRVPTSRRRPVQRRPSTQRTPTSTVAIPGMGTARSACEDRCLSTPQYNPVCGDDDVTYFSMDRLLCAQKCGKSK